MTITPESDSSKPDWKLSNDNSGIYDAHHLHTKGYSRFFEPQGAKELQNRTRFVYFCDWYPKLFGIDEDEIPASEDEEGVFDLGWSDIEEQAMALTSSELDRMRVGERACLRDDEMRQAWLREQRPIYGRRARVKQTYLDDNEQPFKCICDVDLHYSRHHRPHFGGGVAKEGEELRVPHFRTFWEDFKERGEFGDADRFSDIFKSDDPGEEKGVFQRPSFKFKELSKQRVKKMRKELLSTFRPLHCREVRRYRMPYSEALYLELQEDDCLAGAAFLKHLIITDYFVHQAPDNFGPCLRDNRLILNKIFDVLKLAERYAKREEYHKEAYLYLRTGKHFNDRDNEWWWLAEEFYVRAVKASKNCVIDGGKAEAISNYILGTFLLECVDRVQPSQEHLLRARELSMGKDWSARNILQKHQDTVHKECATYLCRALIASSKELRKNGKPEEALPLIHRSYKLCEEVGSLRPDIEMETYFELGLTYQAVGMFDWAKTSFRKFVGLAEMQDFVRAVCDGYLELAICYRSEGDLEKCYRNIMSYNTAAKKKGEVNLMAFGNRYLGEFLLNSGKPGEASEHLLAAFNSFLQQCNECSDIPFSEWQPEHFTLPADVELTRVLYGLAQGELLSKSVRSLIFEAKDQETLLHLMKWKNSGDPAVLDSAVKYLNSPQRLNRLKHASTKDVLDDFDENCELDPANCGRKDTREETEEENLEEGENRIVRFVENELFARKGSSEKTEPKSS